MKGETNKLAALPSLTEAQRLAGDSLRRQGFDLASGADETVLLMRRGNDFRVVWLDGSVRRGLGAKR